MPAECFSNACQMPARIPVKCLPNAFQMPKVDKNADFLITYPPRAQPTVCLQVKPMSNHLETSRILSKLCGLMRVKTQKLINDFRIFLIYIHFLACFTVCRSEKWISNAKNADFIESLVFTALRRPSPLVFTCSLQLLLFY